MASEKNHCMMHYEFGQDDASVKAKQLIEVLKEAARWYDEFIQETHSGSPKGEE